jgi:hypothetical protein
VDHPLELLVDGRAAVVEIVQIEFEFCHNVDRDSWGSWRYSTACRANILLIMFDSTRHREFKKPDVSTESRFRGGRNEPLCDSGLDASSAGRHGFKGGAEQHSEGELDAEGVILPPLKRHSGLLRVSFRPP